MTGKKGISISGTTEAVLVLLGIVVIVGAITGLMNNYYSVSSTSTPIIFSSTTQTYIDKYVAMTDSSYNKTQQGEVSLSGASTGFSWSGAWQIPQIALSMAWDFFSGAWIGNILYAIFGGFNDPNATIPTLKLVEYVLRTIFLIGLVYALVTLATQVKNP